MLTRGSQYVTGLVCPGSSIAKLASKETTKLANHDDHKYRKTTKLVNHDDHRYRKTTKLAITMAVDIGKSAQDLILEDCTSKDSKVGLSRGVYSRQNYLKVAFRD
ncbi:hypothetical protein K501DRAFT_333842 [Backusella circina FSU 941]|nr:hypothetical protein K501DRAFT_333842 [Backusella circina FSU 941]